MSVEETPDPVASFGDRRADKVYRRRPGAYGVAFAGGLVATVESNGAYALPGGGIDFGETMEMALLREVREGTGLSVVAHGYLVTATQFHTNRRTDSLEKICHYFLVQLGDEPDPTVDPEHALVWQDVPAAMDTLANGADRFALQVAQRALAQIRAGG